MAPLVNESITPFAPSDYIQTAGTGNRVSRKAVIMGSSSIMLGGKCVIHHGVILRGDLKRRDLLQAAGTAPQTGKVGAPTITCGRYCVFGDGAVIRPGYKTYKGNFSYYTVRMGDHVHIGAGSIVEAAALGSHVEVGRGVVLGKLSQVKDCVRILDGAVVPASAVLASGTVWAGSPAQCIAELPESFAEQFEARSKDYYTRFKPAVA